MQPWHFSLECCSAAPRAVLDCRCFALNLCRIDAAALLCCRTARRLLQPSRCACLQGLQLNAFVAASLTTGTLCGISDVLSQCIEARVQRCSSSPFSWQWQRTLRMAGCGYVLLGPYMKAWYGMLARTLPGASLRNFVGKVTLNQVNTPVRMQSCPRSVPGSTVVQMQSLQLLCNVLAD